MIYLISGSFEKRKWEIRCVHSFLPENRILGEVRESSNPQFDYNVFLDSKSLEWGADTVIELLLRGRALIQDYILNERIPEKIWYKDLGQL